MPKTTVFTLAAIRYDGVSIGSDVRVEVDILGKTAICETKLKKGDRVTPNLQLGSISGEQKALTLVATIRVIEGDVLFPDKGQVAVNLKIDPAAPFPQRFTHTIAIRESRGFLTKRTARFEITIEADVKQNRTISTKGYVESAWSIYEKGLKKEKSTGIKLWSIAALMALLGGVFLYVPTQPSLAFTIMQTVAPDERTDIEDIEAEFEPAGSLFWAIIVRRKDWWEELRVGRKQGTRIQWLTIDTPPTEQSILSTRFMQLNGFTDPILEVYGETHMGYGALHLYAVRNGRAESLLETAAVDFNADAAATTGNYEQYGYHHCSPVFENGILKTTYDDLNHDDVSDLRLIGVAKTICDTLEDRDGDGYTEDVMVAQDPIEERYLWDVKARRFIRMVFE